MGMRWMSGRGHTLPVLLIEAQEEEKGPLPEAKGLTCLPADLPLGWGLCGRGSVGGLLPSGGGQLLLRDCGGLGRELAGHVLPPWNASPSGLWEPLRGVPSSLVRDCFQEKVSVGGAAWTCSLSSGILEAM